LFLIGFYPRKYVLSDWLSSLSHGAYVRPGQAVGWEGVLLGLQRLVGVSCCNGILTQPNICIGLG